MAYLDDNSEPERFSDHEAHPDEFNAVPYAAGTYQDHDNDEVLVPPADLWDVVRAADSIVRRLERSHLSCGHSGWRSSFLKRNPHKEALLVAMKRLMALRDEEGIRDLVAVYGDAIGEERRAAEAEDREGEARRTGQDQLETEARTVECPYCGVAPNDFCISSPGRNPTTFHADRLRAARHILTPANPYRTGLRQYRNSGGSA